MEGTQSPLGGLGSDLQGKVKGFWEKKEGTTGMIVIVAVIALIILSWGYWLPALAIALGTILGKIIGGIILFVLLFMASQKRTWVYLNYMFKAAMTRMTSWFVATYPVEIAEERLADCRKEREKLAGQKSTLNGQVTNLRDTMSANEKEARSALSMVKQARDQGKTTTMILKSRAAGRLKESNMTLRELLTKLEILYRVIQKYLEASDFLIADMEDTIKVKKVERKAMLAGWNAMMSAKAILRGDPDKMELYNRAMEFMTNDFSSKMGEIMEFSEMSRGFIEGMDLQNGVYAQEALDMLQKWEDNPESLLLGASAKSQLLSASYDDSNILDVTVEDATPEAVPTIVTKIKSKPKYVDVSGISPQS